MSTLANNQSVRVTNTSVEKAPTPTTGQLFLRDTDLKGFGLRVSPHGTKSYIVEKRVNGKVRRITLGKAGELTATQARQLAQRELGKIAMGVDPIAERQRAKARLIPLKQAHQEFIQNKKRRLAEKTLYDYERLYQVAFQKWHNTAMVNLTRAMVLKLHQELTDNRGESYANSAMRYLRAVINFAMDTYQDTSGHHILSENPVTVLNKTKSWNKTTRRQTFIKAYELENWYNAVESLRTNEEPYTHGDDMADYFLLTLFTGMRKNEGLKLQWSQVDLKGKTLHLPNPKNGEPFTLPLPGFVQTLLEKRHAAKTNPYVFPGRNNVGCFIEPKHYVKAVVDRSNTPFTLHDLRRTFATMLDSLEMSSYTAKRLLNHLSGRNDVTGGYIITDIERMREPMEKIAQRMMEYCKIPSNIIELEQKQDHAER